MTKLTVIGDYLWDSAYTREVDRLTSERYGIAPEILMENAGRSVADAVLEAADGDSPIIVLAGTGGNGGDALVAARYLSEAGAEVHTFLVQKSPGAEQSLSPLCARQAKILAALGQKTHPYAPGALKAFKRREPIIIDGVLGIGLKGPLDEDSLTFAALTEASTLEGRTVFAVDVPSGLDVDRGDEQEVPLKADATLTFGGMKPAHALAPARDVCGEVMSLAIGFPHAAVEAALSVHKPSFMRPDPTALLEDDPWERMKPSAHKFDRGHVLVIGGSAGKTGAPILSALAALSAGAGWATVAMPESAFASLRGDVPREITFEPLFDGEKLNPLKLARFLDERRVKAVVCGPGSMENPLGPEALAELAESMAFVVLDAGATKGLGTLLPPIDTTPERWIATPHPGEWLSTFEGADKAIPVTHAGVKRADVEAERLGISLLYKGATPVLVTGQVEGEPIPALVATEGSSVLARAGTGDVLSGVIGAHGAQGINAAASALRSQLLVAFAGELAAKKKGRHGVLARDLIEHIGHAAASALAALAEQQNDHEEEDDDED